MDTVRSLPDALIEGEAKLIDIVQHHLLEPGPGRSLESCLVITPKTTVPALLGDNPRVLRKQGYYGLLDYLVGALTYPG